jgi:hypothetical protein
MAKAQRFNIQELAEKLTQVRENNGMSAKEPPACECEPISMGCYCGRFEYEMALKNKTQRHAVFRNVAHEPEMGDVYFVSRPPQSEIDYADIPFRVWAKCDGKRVEVDLVQPDDHVESLWWCWIDVSHITKNPDDEYWFPSDGLLK